VALMLSLYGVAAAIIGGAAVGTLGAPLEVVKNWVYFIAGIFALLFALGSVGLVKFKMPSYTGAAPAFIQKRGDVIKAFLLGLFLGNIGVGCPHPATPLLLVEIASSGDVLYGWLLFFTHAVGRILPLLFLALLGIAGVNGLSWLIARKDKIERATGWAMIFVAGFILTLGLFTHDWWVNSGIHTTLEKVTQEELLLNIVSERLGTAPAHEHGVEEGTGLLGLPLWLGNWALVLLWVIPLWWWFAREKRRVLALPPERQVSERDAERRLLRMRQWYYAALTLLLGFIFIYYLPHSFLEQASPAMRADHSPAMEAEKGSMMGDMMEHDASGGHVSAASGGYLEEGEVTQGLRVRFTGTGESPSVGGETTLSFAVEEAPEGTPVDDLQIGHEKDMHVIGMRNDLTEFFHVHPEKDATGVWKTSITFTKGGTYKLWSDVTRAGATHTFGHPMFFVAGEGSDEPATPVVISKNVIVDGYNASAGGYQVALHYDGEVAVGRATSLHFTVRDVYGRAIAVEPYLGAAMHLAAVKDDLSAYIHTHPEGVHEQRAAGAPLSMGKGFPDLVPTALAHGGEETMGLAEEEREISFSVVFPTAGIYKLFAQFRPKGITLPSDTSLVAAFGIKVEEERAARPRDGALLKTEWGGKLVVSLVLIVLLSLVTRKYLRG
ncbi:MAG: cytochrome c bioproteinis protein transmembrane region, partial [Parcubacteria group bacterium Gr01-1014_72]